MDHVGLLNHTREVLATKCLMLENNTVCRTTSVKLIIQARQLNLSDLFTMQLSCQYVWSCNKIYSCILYHLFLLLKSEFFYPKVTGSSYTILFH